MPSIPTADAGAAVLGFACLELPLAPFVAGVREAFRLLRVSQQGEAVVRYSAGELHVSCGGAQFSTPAGGRWPGEARVSASLWVALAKVPPTQDPLSMSVRDGRLRVGSSSAPCRWQKDGLARVEVPLGATLLDILRLGAQHDLDTLRQSGVDRVVTQARADADRRLQEAARKLAPLGIGLSQLNALLDLRIRAGLSPRKRE
jgi:hypothetical protein